MVDRIEKQERSFVVQGRVDIVVLADLAVCLMNKGHIINSQSALISRGLELAHYALDNNGLMEHKHKNVRESYDLLLGLGLMPKSMDERNRRKLHTSKGFSNLRIDGSDPSISAPQKYNSLHNAHSVEPANIAQTEGENIIGGYSDIELQAIAKNTAKKIRGEQKEAKRKIEEMKASADENGVIKTLPAQEFRDKIPSVVNEIKPKLGRPPKSKVECVIESDPPNNISEEQTLINNVENAKALHKKTGNGSEYNKAIAELNAFRAKNSINSKGKFEPARKKTDEENSIEEDRISKKDEEYFKLVNSDAMLRPQVKENTNGLEE